MSDVDVDKLRDDFEGTTWDELRSEISDGYMGETGDLCRDFATAILTVRRLLAELDQARTDNERLRAGIRLALTNSYSRLDMSLHLREALAAASVSGHQETQT